MSASSLAKFMSGGCLVAIFLSCVAATALASPHGDSAARHRRNIAIGRGSFRPGKRSSVEELLTANAASAVQCNADEHLALQFAVMKALEDYTQFRVQCSSPAASGDRVAPVMDPFWSMKLTDPAAVHELETLERNLKAPIRKQQ